MKSKKKKIFLGAFLNYTNAQNINCLALSNHLNLNKYSIYSMSVSFRPKVKTNAKIFKCSYPFKLTSKIGFLWGIIICDVAYLPKHTSTPKWILKFANLLNRKIFTTIEANMCDTLKERSMIKAFKGSENMIRYFNNIKNIYPITKHLRDNSNCGVLVNKNVLHLGVNTSNFNPIIREKLKNIVFVGTVEKAKGIIEFSKLSKLYTDLKFHVIGDGPSRKIIEEEYNNSLIFHGLIPNAKLDNILKDMDLLILPSRAEGFPKVILEAASSGIPSIVFSDYGANEWIVNNDSGFVVDTFEQIKESIDFLINNISELKKKSENAIILSNKFDWKSVVIKWDKIISELK